MTESLELDALIFGGGAAGLWLLDELHRRGFHVALAESRALGAGQTVASQGILHGGLKYALSGLFNASANAVAEMPARWRACLGGHAEPSLVNTRVLSPCCFLWRTRSVGSMLGLVGAKWGLRTPVEVVPPTERPLSLSDAPGEVLRVDEPVVDVQSFLADLAIRHAGRLLHVGELQPNDVDLREPGEVRAITLRSSNRARDLIIRPRRVLLTAGEGNQSLRHAMGLTTEIMQRRALHMVLVRGRLPLLFGHCVEGGHTRATITSVPIDDRHCVWQVGGQIAERGVERTSADLIHIARAELSAILPGVNFNAAEWATYRINRAEGLDPRGARPEGPVWRKEGATFTAWPTKLVLVPQLAESLAEALQGTTDRSAKAASLPQDWPQPPIAKPPWEEIDEWQA